MQQKVVMGVSSVRQTVISSGHSQAAQFISNGLPRKTQIATPVPIIATIGFRHAKTPSLHRNPGLTSAAVAAKRVSILIRPQIEHRIKSHKEAQKAQKLFFCAFCAFLWPSYSHQFAAQAEDFAVRRARFHPPTS